MCPRMCSYESLCRMTVTCDAPPRIPFARHAHAEALRGYGSRRALQCTRLDWGSESSRGFPSYGLLATPALVHRMGMEMTASRLPYCRKARPVLGIRLVYRPRPGGMAPRPQAITFVRCDVVWRVCRYGSCLSWCPLSAIPPERPPSAGILVFPTRFPRVPRRYHAATGENHGVAIRSPYGPLSSLSTPFINRYPPSGATAEQHDGRPNPRMAP